MYLRYVNGVNRANGKVFFLLIECTKMYLRYVNGVTRTIAKCFFEIIKCALNVP